VGNGSVKTAQLTAGCSVRTPANTVSSPSMAQSSTHMVLRAIELDRSLLDPTPLYIEVLNVNPRHKKAIILLLYRTFVKVLKDALAHLGPYQTLTKVRHSDPYGDNTVPLPATIKI
jgi:hypothetical protein